MSNRKTTYNLQPILKYAFDVVIKQIAFRVNWVSLHCTIAVSHVHLYYLKLQLESSSSLVFVFQRFMVTTVVILFMFKGIESLKQNQIFKPQYL